MDKIFLSLDRHEFKSLIKEALSEIPSEREQSSHNENILINVQEAAALLNLAVATVYEKTSERLIPHYKHRKKLMFKKFELLAWVGSRKIKSINEICTESRKIIKK